MAAYVSDMHKAIKARVRWLWDVKTSKETKNIMKMDPYHFSRIRDMKNNPPSSRGRV